MFSQEGWKITVEYGEKKFVSMSSLSFVLINRVYANFKYSLPKILKKFKKCFGFTSAILFVTFIVI